MTAQIIKGYFPGKIVQQSKRSSLVSAIDTTKKLWIDQAHSMRKRINEPNSFEEYWLGKMYTAEWRAEGHQNSADWHGADLEIVRADTIKSMLKSLKEWE